MRSHRIRIPNDEPESWLPDYLDLPEESDPVTPAAPPTPCIAFCDRRLIDERGAGQGDGEAYSLRGRDKKQTS